MYELFYTWFIPVSCAGALAALASSLLAPASRKPPGCCKVQIEAAAKATCGQTLYKPLQK